MASHQREQKAKKVAVSEIEKEDVDCSMWESYVPDLQEKLESNRVEIRVSAMKTMTHMFSTTFVGMDIDPYMNDIMTTLQEILGNYTCPEEEREVCNLICALGMNMGVDFEPYGCVVLSDVLQGLQQLQADELPRLMMIAILAAFCTDDTNTKKDVINGLIGFINAKHQEIAAEAVPLAMHALAIVLSASKGEIVDAYLDKIRQVLDVKFNSSKVEILRQVLELTAVIYDYLRSKDDAMGDEQLLSKEFAQTYRDRVNAVHRGLIGTKADMKELKKKSTTVMNAFDGEIQSEQICLHDQNVDFFGKRMLVLVKAIRQLTTCNFEAQMARNETVHKFFGYRLLPSDEVARLRKKYQVEIKRRRDENTKEREREVAKKRKQKQDMAEMELQ